MELKQLEYILAIAQEQSISKAAEKLYITQSALNQQLLRLERQLGITLFERFHHSMIPTYAGKVYLEGAQKILSIKSETYKILADISNNTRGEISIAYTPERGSVMFSKIYPKFHKIFPEITFKIYEARVKRMEQMLRQNTVSIAFIALTEENKDFEYFDLRTELMILALPKSHPLAYLAGEESYNSFPEIDLRLLEHDPFVLMTHETRFRDMVDKAFEEAGFEPNVLFESTSTYTVVSMVENQVCAAFLPQSYVDKNLPMVYFSVNKKMCWTLTIAYRKGNYLSIAEKEFMRLARESEHAQMEQQGQKV